MVNNECMDKTRPTRGTVLIHASGKSNSSLAGSEYESFSMWRFEILGLQTKIILRLMHHKVASS